MPDMNIKFETLAQAEVDLGVAYRAAQDVITELETALKHKLGEWTGEAEAAYTQAQKDWAKAFQHMQHVLNQAHVHIATAHELYTQVERQNVTIWR